MPKSHYSRLDLKTREFIRAWGRKVTPTARVAGGKVDPGDYRAFAVLGWIEKRTDAALVGLQTILLDKIEPKHIGALTLALPVTARTELLIVAFLEELGWDGRVWPYKDHGWPEGTDDEAQVMGLIQKIGLGATMTFAPVTNQGVPSVELHVSERRGSYPLVPFPAEATSLVHLESFRALVRDPAPFRP